MKNETLGAISARFRTILGSYRPEIEEVDEIPTLIDSFDDVGVSALKKEAGRLIKDGRVNADFIERMTAWRPRSDKNAVDFFQGIVAMLNKDGSLPPDIEDYL